MSAQPIKPPSLADLFRRYLDEQADAHAQGLAPAEMAGDVVLHEAVPVQPIDARQAWDDAQAVLSHFPGLPKPRFTAPPDWSALLAGQAPAVALSFCLGNTPQLVRNLQPFLAGGDLAALRVMPPGGVAPPGLPEWSGRASDDAGRLLAAGVLRLAGCYDEAARRLQGIAGAWQTVAANESAALAWHRGQAEEARARWNEQAESVPVLFNRGMANLFLGDFKAAVPPLTAAVAALPETSPWYHLGRLYAALAEAR